MEGELDSSLMTKYFVLTCKIDPEQALPLVLANKNIQLDEAIQVRTLLFSYLILKVLLSSWLHHLNQSGLIYSSESVTQKPALKLNFEFVY